MCAYGLALCGGINEIYYFIKKLVTLFVRFLCRTERFFFSTFSFRKEISEALKSCLRGLREGVGEASHDCYKVVIMTTTNKNVFWDTNQVLAAFNPRLTNQPTNLALNNALLNPC